MKMYLLAFIFIYSMIGCEKNNDSNSQIDKKDLIGKWVNTIEEKDTLFFNDTIIIRLDSRTFEPIYKYSYTLLEDSIRLKYVGAYYIEVLDKSFKIMLDRENMILTIENLSNYFPKNEGNKFKKIIIKNKKI